MTLSARNIASASIVFTACNASSHGFSIFLYSALLPRIREAFNLDYSQAALIAAMLQVAYMTASLLSGIAAAALGARRLVALSISACPILLALAVASEQVWAFAVCLALVSACAVTNWNALTALAAEIIPSTHRSRVLGLASSGAAFAICINGALIAALGNIDIQQFWWICAGITLTVALATVVVLASLPKPARAQAGIAPSLQRQAWQWLDLCRSHSVARHILMLSAFIGAVSGPFLNFLSAFASAHLGADAASVGALWLLIGASGAAGGLMLGWLADRWGTLRIMGISMAAFGIALVAMMWRHDLPTTWLCAGLFALFYFPVWGLMAAYVSQRLDALQSLQVVSLSMVGYGLGSALANSACGALLQASDSFTLVHGWIAAWLLASLCLLARMQHSQRLPHATVTSG